MIVSQYNAPKSDLSKFLWVWMWNRTTRDTYSRGRSKMCRPALPRLCVQGINAYSKAFPRHQQDSSSERVSTDRSVLGSEGCRQTMLINLTETETCICIKILQIASSYSSGSWYKCSSKKHRPDWEDLLLISSPETKFAIIISAVSNLSSVTVQQQGQQSDFWNVPCELDSIWCTSKYTFRETEMSFFKVTGASTRRIMCLTLA